VADNFGLKIGIEGEKEFKNAIREINQSFKVLGSEMNLVASQFDKQDKSVEAVAARNKVLNKEIELQKEKLLLWKKRLLTPPPLSGRPTSGRNPGRYSLTTPKQN